MEDVKKWIWEGVKTAGRIGLIAFLTALADTLRQSITGTHFDEQTKWLFLLALAGLDKVVFLWKKETDSRPKALGFEWKGLLPF